MQATSIFATYSEQNVPTAQVQTSCCWRGRFIFNVRQIATCFAEKCTRLWNGLFATEVAEDVPLRHATAFVRLPTSNIQPQVTNQFDPAMLQLQAFMTNVATMMGNSVYLQAVLPAISAVSQDIQKWPDQLAGWEQFSAFFAKAIAAEIVQITEDAAQMGATTAKLALSWLVYGSTGEDTKGALQKSLSEQYESKLSTQPGLLDRFLIWLCDKDRLTSLDPLPSLQSACQVSSSALDLLQSLLVTSLQKLIDNKLREFFQALSSFLQSDVGTFFQQSLQQNSACIAKIVACRFATLIQAGAPLSPGNNGPTIYQQNYDRILQIFLNHVQAILNAYKHYRTMPIEQGFAKDDACDPNVRLMVNPPANQDVKAYQSSIEVAVCGQAANTILDLLLPSQVTEINGFAISTPGVVFLLRELQIPPEVSQAFRKMMQLPAELFSNGLPPSFEQLSSCVIYFIEKATASIINDQLENGLKKGLQIGINYVVPPEFLSMWMVQGAFSAMNTALLQSLLCIKLSDPSEEITTNFLDVFLQPNNRAVLLPRLGEYLYELVRKSCTDVSLVSCGVTPNTFTMAIAPFMIQVMHYLEQNPPKERTVASKDVKEALIALTTPTAAGSNKVYGSLLKALAVDIGGLKLLHSDSITQDVCQLFLEKIISRSLTSAIDPLRTNEQLLVSGLISGLNQKLANQAQIDQLLFGPPLTAVNVEAELDLQVSNLGAMLHTLLTLVVDQMPHHSNQFEKFFKKLAVDALKKLLPSKKDLTVAVGRIYTALLSKRYLNESLYLQLQNVILQGLKDSDTVLKSTRS